MRVLFIICTVTLHMISSVLVPVVHFDMGIPGSDASTWHLVPLKAQQSTKDGIQNPLYASLLQLWSKFSSS